MFIGHFAIGFGAKAIEPRVSLGTYFFAAQFVDLLWPTLLLLGIEQVSIEPGITEMTPLNFSYYPISHSLVMAFAWAGIIGLLYWALTRSSKASLIIAMCVASHWLHDFIVHRPDLPITFGQTTKAGLGLWNNLPVTLILEFILFAIGVWLYNRSTKATDRIGSIAFWALVIFFVLIHLSNVFGPPPPSVTAIAWAGHLQWLFVIWAWWVDKHRTVSSALAQGQP